MNSNNSNNKVNEQSKVVNNKNGITIRNYALDDVLNPKRLLDKDGNKLPKSEIAKRLFYTPNTQHGFPTEKECESLHYFIWLYNVRPKTLMSDENWLKSYLFKQGYDPSYHTMTVEHYMVLKTIEDAFINKYQKVYKGWNRPKEDYIELYDYRQAIIREQTKDVRHRQLIDFNGYFSSNVYRTE